MVCNVAVLVNLMIPMTCLNAQNLGKVHIGKPPASSLSHFLLI